MNSCFKTYSLAVIRKIELDRTRWGMRSPVQLGQTWDGGGVAVFGHQFRVCVGIREQDDSFFSLFKKKFF